MKKKILGVAIVAAIALVSGWNISQSMSEVALSDVSLANVEALADGENSLCSKNIWYSASSSCCDLIKHCDDNGNWCC
jgi:hypothetical protein